MIMIRMKIERQVSMIFSKNRLNIKGKNKFVRVNIKNINIYFFNFGIIHKKHLINKKLNF